MSEKQNAETLELADKLVTIFDRIGVSCDWRLSSEERQDIAKAAVALHALHAAAPSRCDRCGSSGDVFVLCSGCHGPIPSPHPRGEPVAWQIEINGIWQNLPGDWSESENNPNHVYRPLYAAPPPAGADAVRIGQAGVQTIPLPMWAAEDLLKWMRKTNDREPVLYPIGLENLLQALVSALSPAPQPQEKPTGDQT